VLYEILIKTANERANTLPGMALQNIQNLEEDLLKF